MNHQIYPVSYNFGNPSLTGDVNVYADRGGGADDFRRDEGDEDNGWWWDVFWSSLCEGRCCAVNQAEMSLLAGLFLLGVATYVLWIACVSHSQDWRWSLASVGVTCSAVVVVGSWVMLAVSTFASGRTLTRHTRGVIAECFIALSVGGSLSLFGHGRERYAAISSLITLASWFVTLLQLTVV